MGSTLSESLQMPRNQGTDSLRMHVGRGGRGVYAEPILNSRRRRRRGKMYRAGSGSGRKGSGGGGRGGRSDAPADFRLGWFMQLRMEKFYSYACEFRTRVRMEGQGELVEMVE